MSATAALPETSNSSNLSAGVHAGSAGALIMGADYRGLGVVRSLGRRGIPVWVIKQGGHLVATTSRYVCRNISWPPKDERRQIDFLLDLAAKQYLNEWVLFPTDDYAVTLVSRNYEALASHYRLTVPPWEELRWACDKRLLHRLAHDLGVHQPWAAAPNSREELAALDHSFPLILKPALRMEPGSLAIPKAWRIDDRASLLARYDEACALIAPENLIVQELVPGGGESQFSYAALCKDGMPLASIVARRTRQYPMDFGQFSTYVETVDEPQVIEPSVRLLKALRFTGLVEVEFKKDPRDGQCKVIDINPRVWGWHTLSRRCGVDFPHLLWLLLRGESFSQLHGRAGQRWMHMSSDMSVAIREILAAGSHFGIMRGHCEDHWSLPFLPGTIPCLDFSICRFSPAPSACESFGERRLSAFRETAALAHRRNDMIPWIKHVLRVDRGAPRWRSMFDGAARFFHGAFLRPARRSRRRFSGQTN